MYLPSSDLGALSRHAKQLAKMPREIESLYKKIDPKGYLISIRGIGRTITPAVLGIVGDVSRFPRIGVFKKYFANPNNSHCRYSAIFSFPNSIAFLFSSILKSRFFFQPVKFNLEPTYLPVQLRSALSQTLCLGVRCLQIYRDSRISQLHARLCDNFPNKSKT